MELLSRMTPSLRVPHKSYFHTTERRLIHYQLANLIISPSYIVIYLATIRLISTWYVDDIAEQIQSPLSVWVNILVLLGVVSAAIGLFIPWVLSLFLRDKDAHWRTGFNGRGLVTIFSIFIAINIFVNPRSIFLLEERVLFLAIQTCMWIYYALQLLRVQRIVAPILISLLVVVLILLILSTLPEAAKPIVKSDILTSPDTRQQLTLLLLYIASAITVINVVFITGYFVNAGISRKWVPRDIKFTLAKSSFIGILLGTISTSFFYNQKLASSHQLSLLATLCTLIGMFAAAQPLHFLSRQRSYIRGIFAPTRHDYIRNIASPTLNETTSINRFRSWIGQNLTIDNQVLGFSAALFLGFIILPLINIGINSLILDQGTIRFEFHEQSLSFDHLMGIGISSGLIFAFLYLLIWMYRHRQKYIVLPFTTEGTDDKKEKAQLEGVANQFAHNLTQQLRQIGTLMLQRHVDSARGSASSVLAHFVSSGQEPRFVNEIRSLSSVDQNASFFTSLVLLLINTLAVIRLRGSIRKRHDNSYEVWVELTRRDQVVAVDKAIVISSGADDIDETTLQLTVREIALKLLLKLGQSYHLASSWQSLDFFLEGLESSVTGNYWRAVDAYSKAIHNEEAQRGKFAIGHYHLGAALLSLGEIEEAIKYFETAETSGPPIAENDYSFALALTHENWNKLHEPAVRFETQIEDRCRRALRLRPNFPEAWHLLGSASYHRAKLMEREQTRAYDRDPSPLSSTNEWRREYRRARRYFQRALRLYDRELRSIATYRDDGGSSRESLDHLLQSRLTVTHQLADALRSLTHHMEADSYYKDFFAVDPTNTRTLFDAAKNYCLAENWQQADKFILENVLTVPEAEWTADANFYVGWALAGGLNDGFSRTRFYRKRYFNNTSPSEIMGEAINHLDYAFYQRPRFFTRWLQTEWQAPLSSFIDKYKASRVDAYQSPIILEKEKIFFPQALLWLSLRMYEYDYERQRDDRLSEWLHSPISSSVRSKENETYRLILEIYKDHKRQVIERHRKIEASGRLHGMSHAWEKLKDAAIALDIWKWAKTEFLPRMNRLVERKDNWNNHKEDNIKYGPEYHERWIFSVFMNISVFTAHSLLEAWAYETAHTVAYQSSNLIEQWVEKFWDRETSPEKLPYRITPYVFRYQWATLLAIKAYSLLRIYNDNQTTARMKVYKKSSRIGEYNFSSYGALGRRVKAEDIKLAEQWIAKASKVLPRHPLALFVKAEIFEMRGLLDEAADELNRLLQVISPYDPIEYIANWRTTHKHSRERMISYSDSKQRGFLKKTYPTLTARQRMKEQERVTGQETFVNIVNRASIHQKLGDIYNQIPEKQSLAFYHYRHVAVWSRYRDEEADDLIQHAERLDKLDRFRDAQSILTMLGNIRFYLDPQTTSVTKENQVDILTCIMNTRLARYTSALGDGEILWNKINNSLKDDWGDYLQQFNSRFGEQKLQELYNKYVLKMYHMPSNSWLSRFNSFRGNIRHQNQTSNSILPHREQLLKLANLYLNTDLMARDIHDLIAKIPYDFHNPYRDQIPDSNIAARETSPVIHTTWHIVQRMVEFISREALKTLEQFCQLANNIAYNRIQLRIDYDEETDYKQTVRYTNKTLINCAIEIMKELLAMVSEEDIDTTIRYRQYLRNYYDTLGWFWYRNFEHVMGAKSEILATHSQASSESSSSSVSHSTDIIDSQPHNQKYGLTVEAMNLLRDARRDLEAALKYDQSSSIVHYHLARLHLAVLERLWQGIENSDQPRIAEIAPAFQQQLQFARHYFQNANTLDVNNRLSTSLGWIGERLQTLDEQWQSYHLSRFTHKP